MAQKSDGRLLRDFLGGTLYTTAGTGLRIVSSIVATKILATYLPSTEFGYVILIELVANFLSMASGFSIGVAAIRSLTDASRDEQKAIVDTIVLFRLATVLVIALLFLVAQQWVYRLFGQDPIEGLTLLILFFTLVTAYQTVLKQMLQGFFRFKQLALVELVASLLTLLLLAIFLVGFRAGMVGAVWSRLLATGAAGLLFYLFLPTRKGLTFRPHLLRQMLRFSWPLQINEILTFIFSSFGTLVVAAVMTPADVALLAVADKIPANIRRLFESFRTVYFPNLSKLVAQNDYRQAQRVLNVTLRAVAFFTTLAAVVVLVFQKELILLFFSEQYLDAGPLFVITMLSLSISLVGYVLGNSTVAAGNSKAPPISNTVNTTFTIVGNLTLVPLLGLVGAAWASLSGHTLTNPLNVWFLRRTGLLPRVQDYVKPILLFCATWGLFWWLQPQSWALRALFLLAFVAASFALGIFTRQDGQRLWNVLNQSAAGRLQTLGKRRPKRATG